MLKDLIDARRAELHDRMEVAIEVGDGTAIALIADDSAFILASCANNH